MLLRSSSRAWGVALAAALCLLGCGRESLLIDTNPGGGGSGGSGGGGSGGTGGSTCQPAPETCNGLDDNCNGQVDEGCSCTDGQSQGCYSGPPETIGVGPCQQGSQVCKGGQWSVCSGETLPITELCDGADNDCNGQVDNGNPGGGAVCNVGLSGVCGMGNKKCQNGAFVCAQINFPSPEVCDGLDNNCNGQVDDGNPGGGAACASGLPGLCGPGTLSCADGGQQCVPNVSPTVELCDGLDNDCNGQVDDGNPEGGQPCMTGLPGECAAGTTSCAGGALSCKQAKNPTMETCDGLDNDCDGMVDDVPGAGNACTTGGPPPCNVGKIGCQGNLLTCLPNPVGAEVCDGLDNNCNGQVDEGNPGGGGACVTGAPGACSPGTLTCQAGMLACIANASQGAEKCDMPGDENCNGASATVFFSETFASNAAGWTLDTEWQIGPTLMSMGQNYGNPDPAADHSASADNGVAGVVLGGNAAQNQQHPFRWLTSPSIPVDASATSVYLQFWRWLNSDFSPWMTNRVEVFDTLSNAWKLVWQSGNSPGVTDAAWTKQVYDISASSKGGSIKVRFGFNIQANGAFNVSQWNVDDVVITTEPCD